MKFIPAPKKREILGWLTFAELWKGKVGQKAGGLVSARVFDPSTLLTILPLW